MACPSRPALKTGFSPFGVVRLGCEESAGEYPGGLKYGGGRFSIYAIPGLDFSHLSEFVYTKHIR